MKFASLEELLKNAADYAKEMFGKFGEVKPMWICEKDNGDLVLIAGDMPDRRERDEYMGLIKATLRKLGVQRYAFIVEAWAVVTKGEIPLSHRLGASLASHPDRIEVIMVHAADKQREIAGQYKILRPEHGKAKLSPFDFDEKITKLDGRMTRLLAD